MTSVAQNKTEQFDLQADRERRHSYDPAINSAEWREYAECAAPDVNPSVFDLSPDSKPGYRERNLSLAREICAQCVVVAECLEDAIATEDFNLVRAGHKPSTLERLASRKRWNAARPSSSRR